MKASFILDNISILGNSIPVVRTKLNLNDILGAVMVRWGINRNNYRVEPGLYAVGFPDHYIRCVCNSKL